jgi:hypothetical protein
MTFPAFFGAHNGSPTTLRGQPRPLFPVTAGLSIANLPLLLVLAAFLVLGGFLLDILCIQLQKIGYMI